jgi:hypothetical protein
LRDAFITIDVQLHFSFGPIFYHRKEAAELVFGAKLALWAPSAKNKVGLAEVLNE